MKILVIQPHSDDAILSCAHFLLKNDEDCVVKVLTIEKNEKRIQEDKKISEIIGVKYLNLGINLIDDLYHDFFEEYGKKAVLNDDNVLEFYVNHFGENKIIELSQTLFDKIKSYKDKGYQILCPLGVGHPFHYLVRYLLRDIENDFIFYREFPHSYKRKAKNQLESELSNLEIFYENSDEEINSLKYKIAQKFYKTQSGFFFYEQNNVKKLYPEEFYVKKNDKKEKHIKIYVISKDRPNGKTFDLLNRGEVPYTVVVEPQDEQKYRDFGHKNILVLPENDRGFSYTVNYSKSQYDGVNPVVIMDDDITELFFNLEGCTKLSPSLTRYDNISQFFKELNDEICNTDFDIGTIGKSAFDWNNTNIKPKIAYNGTRTSYSGLPVVIIINNPIFLKFDFDESLCFKSDVDYSLKCMYLGLKYAKFIKFVQHTKMNKEGKQKGGLAETYKNTDNIIKVHKILLERWPDNVFVDEKKLKINGIDELRIKYKVSENTPTVITELREKLKF